MAVNRIIYLDCLRVAAITAVIIIHIAASQWYITPVNTFN
jgi:surface polysaccharide O-acyltransferase-like enzyme